MKIILFILVVVLLPLQATTLQLKSGWNLVGSNENAISINTAIPTATTVWKYSANTWLVTSPNTSQTQNIMDSSYATFSQVNAGEGFWVNIANDSNITLDGDIPTSITLNLEDSWNLVSLPTSFDVNISDYFANSNTELVWKYTDGEWKAFSHSLASVIASASIAPIEMLKVGEGFWVKSVGESINFLAPTASIDFTALEGITIYYENENGGFGVRTFNTDGTTTGIVSGIGEYTGTYTTTQDSIIITTSGGTTTFTFAAQPNFTSLNNVSVTVNGSSQSTWSINTPLPTELLNQTISFVNANSEAGTRLFNENGITYGTGDASLVSAYRYHPPMGQLIIRDGIKTINVTLFNTSNIVDMPVLITSDTDAFTSIATTTTWTLPQAAGAATDLQRSLANFIVGSSSGLATAGEVASNSTVGTATTTSITNTLARVLYSSIPPAFVINDSDMVMTMPNIVGNTNVTATVKFKVNGVQQNPNHVMDDTGTSYGLNNMQATMENLGTFFSGFATAGTTQNELGLYIASNVEPHIQAVSTIKASPLFHIVGDTALQNFINGFPIDINSAYSADWQTMGLELQALANTIDTSIDFSKIELFTSIFFDSTLDVGGIDVNLPSLESMAIPLTQYQSTNLVTLNFIGNGDGNAYISGTTATLSNIELNVTMDSANANTTSVNGSYDISVTVEGITYTGTPTFDRNGCKGADIYDENNNFVSRMKIFDDGLWIVDENNVQIEKVITSFN